MNRKHQYGKLYMSVDVDQKIKNAIQSKHEIVLSVDVNLWKLLKQQKQRKYSVWNPEICAPECDKRCHINENLNNCTSIR